MATRPLPEPADSRFASYIEELHEYFTTSGVPFGSPEDFAAFTARLREPGPFADDLGSLIRSFVLRQGGAMPHTELLEILSVAIAGPDLVRAPQKYGESLRQLLGFVSGVMRRPWNVPPGEPAEVVPFPTDPAARASETSAPSETQAAVIPISEPASPPVFTDSDTPRFPVPVPTQDPLNPLPPEPVEPSPVPEPVPVRAAEPVVDREPIPAASAISAALAAESERHPHAFADAPHLDPLASPEPTLLHRPEAVSAANPLSESATPRSPKPRRRNLPIATAGAVLLAALLAIALRSRQPGEVYNVQPVAPGPETASQPAPAAVAPSSQGAQPVASGTSYPPKPSAYGPALTDRASRHARAQQVQRADNPDIAEPYSSSPQYAPQRAFNQTAQAGAAQPSAGTPRADGLIPRPQTSAPVTYAPYTPGGDASPQTQPAAPVVREPAQTALRDPDAAYAGEYPPGTQFRSATSAGRSPSFAVSSGVMAANLISSPEPDYPMIARLAHIQGQVILQAVIAKDGTVSTTRVLRGNRLLRGAAEEAVRQWRYRPYRLNGRPIDVATIVTVDFHNGPTQ